MATWFNPLTWFSPAPAKATTTVTATTIPKKETAPVTTPSSTFDAGKSSAVAGGTSVFSTPATT